MNKYGIFIIAAILAYTFHSLSRLSTDLETAKGLLQKSKSFAITIVEILRQSPSEVFAIAKIDSVNASMLVKIPMPEIALFDRLVVTGEVNFDLDSKLANYFKVKRIVASLEVSSISSIDSYFSVAGYFYRIRLAMLEILTSKLNYRSAALLAGIMWGDTDLLSSEVKDDFKKVGLSHVMAISGSNMTLLAQIVVSVLYFLPIRWRYLMTVIFIGLFSGIVGMSAAVVRAGLMAIVAAVASISGQKYWSQRAFIFVLVVVLIFNPLIVLYDVGFHLSCAATASLLFLNVHVTMFFMFVRNHGLRNLLASTVTVSLGVLPITFYYFSLWYPLSLFVNIFLLPLISLFSMVLYFVFILLLVPFIQDILAVLISTGLSVLLELIQILATISSSVVLVWHIPIYAVFFSYFLIVFLIVEKGWVGIISRVKSLIGKP